MNLLYQWWGYLPKSIFEWGIVGNFNHMFGWMGAAKFTGLQWEDVVALSQERPGQMLPAQVAKILIHSDLTPQTTSLAFASQLTWAFDDCESHSDASVNPICTGSSGYPSDCMTPLATGVFFLQSLGICHAISSPLQQCSYCHCTTPYKCILYHHALG